MLRSLVLLAAFAWALAAQSNRGYYRFPAIHGKTVVFTAEGDLWQVGIEGGVARRVTTHPGDEIYPSFSPDGTTLAFSANYEGPTEVYTMPAAGGLPMRRTFEGANAIVAGWTPDGKVLYASRRHSTLPDLQLLTVDRQNLTQIVPLSQAAQGAYDAAGKTLFFTRLAFQGSYAKRYKGGTAQKLWKFTPGAEAVPLTVDYAGASKDAQWWNGRVYFLSDRDGTMNIWSMDENGRNLRQHTKHEGWDAQSPSLSGGRIVYKLGADLRLFDIAAGSDKAIPIEISSDFDHLRERWVKPDEYGGAVNLSWDGNSVVMGSRGKIFVAPVKSGRLVEATAGKAARFRDGWMMPDGKALIVLSSESGEVELWKLPANGIGSGERLTTDGKTLRFDAVPSPDGKWIAHQDKDNQLWLLEVSTKMQKRIRVDEHNSGYPGYESIAWSPDSRWITWTEASSNEFSRIVLYNVEKGTASPLTTDRFNSGSAVWSPDGKWIYFLSDRALRSVVSSPWGSRAPDPHFDRTEKIYQLALKKGQRSPFEPADELNPDKPEEKPAPDKAAADKAEPAKPAGATDEKKKEPPAIEIELDGIASRIEEVPVPPGNYRNLTVTAKRLCWLSFDRAEPDKTALQCVSIANKGDKPETITDGVRGYQLSGDGKKLLIRKPEGVLLVVDSSITEAAMKVPKTVADARVDLKDWTFSVKPQEEFREIFLDAWRLHRDYFYDRKMHGVNWTLMRDKYIELVGRVRDRAELSDLIAQLVGELSALHTSVRGGDLRRGQDQIQLASLGARIDPDHAAGGYIVRHIYKSDPDRPDKTAPLARPGAGVSEGDIILSVNGIEAGSAAGIGELLRNKANKQVLLRVRPAGKTEPRDVIVKPITLAQEADLRYHEWEYTRRLKVDEAGEGRLGYVHLRAMGPNDISQWAEHFYPVFNRAGLIVDVRHNGGGNIDSWILGRLLRRAWMYWQGRNGKPYWNMQYAFRGHMVLLCDEWTGSDGEAFAEGFKRLGMGKAIGTRTWGGEIWLTASNTLVDRGIATAAEFGVFGVNAVDPKKYEWLIEGNGFVPDIVVDNLPHATFNGADAQLDAAINHLKGLLKEKPVTVPPPPPYPDKTGKPAIQSSGAQ